ncbi:MAG: 16S rRNA (cytidine(1402)-2'-O)-methyltransferase [Campylobacterota bacterium]|nr:16S rRNA (cytidine(1402)-2'-O)-methyltransferase [Campylobacterota bacterium]
MLTLAATPIGNISDISLRTIDVLSEADILLCEDTRVTKKLLNILKERHNLITKDIKFISLHSHNEQQFIQNLEDDFFTCNVVYLSDAGMPCVSDPGQLLVKHCIQNGIEYDVLPGANALLTAFVASGMSDTSFMFYGFLPHKGSQRAKALLDALYSGYTTIIYEAPHRLEKILKEINDEDSSREIFVAKELSKKFQKYLSGTASQIIEKLDGNYKGEWVIVIKASKKRVSTLSEKDILELDIQPKIAAKLISKITGESIKDCYNKILKNN